MATAPKRYNVRPDAFAELPKSIPAVAEALANPQLSAGECIQLALSSFGERPALGWRRKFGGEIASQFSIITYDELLKQVMSLASAFTHDEQFALKPGDIVTTLGFASPEYVAILLALQFNGLPYVALQSSTAFTQMRDITLEVEPRSSATSIEQLEAAVSCALAAPTVRAILVFDVDNDDPAHSAAMSTARQRLANSDIALVTFDETMERGAALPRVEAYKAPAGTDPLNTIVYTSGSTGSPKGAMYNQSNGLSAWKGARFGEPQIVLNYQPLSHAFGTIFTFKTLARGGAVCFTARSDLSTLVEDIALVRPTEIGFVPRICELVYQRACAGKQPGASHDFAALRDGLMGGRVRVASTGSAPLSPELKDFMRDLLGFPLVDTYGATESGIVASDGVIQKPPVVEHKLIDVPELGYFTTDKPHPRGELAVRTASLIAGYYKRPELNAKLVDDDGFYHTGDIMEEVAPGQIRYVDRRNNVIKLAQGEFVTVAKLESLYASDSSIRQIFLYGNSSRSFLLGVAVPNLEVLDADAHEPGIKQRLMAAIREVATQNDLNSYEIPRNIIVEADPFTIENGLLAGIGKYLRPKLYEKYQGRLEAMYADMAKSQDDALGLLRATANSMPITDTVLSAARIALGIDETLGGSAVSFDEIGGDSLSAVSLALLLEDVFDVSVDVGDILHPTDTLLDLARKIEGRRNTAAASRGTFQSVHGKDVRTVYASDLSLDKFLSSEVMEAAPNLAPVRKGEPKTVLLTGANGFLGRFVALEWMERLSKVGGALICMGRGADDQSARARVRDAFVSGDADLERRFDELARDHLEVLSGDLGAPRLGLTDAVWQDLAQRVDVIVHVGALVNHKLPYRQLFQPNVAGTAELIELALTTRKKRFVNVSTIGAVFDGKGGVIDEDVDIRAAIPQQQLGDGYAVGYAASKWAAEILLREASEKFGLPANVFRSNMILAHRVYRGQLNIPDVFTRLILSLAVTRIAPKSFYVGALDHAHYEGLPVDFIAQAIVAIGENAREGHHTYHILNPHDDGVSLDSFVKWMDSEGKRIRVIEDYADWRSRFETALRALPEDIRAKTSLAVIDMFDRPAQAAPGSQMSSKNFQKAIEAVAPTSGGIPHLDRGLIEKYLADIEQLGLLH